MRDASFYRIGALALIVGGILALVFNVLHPRASDTTSTEMMLRMVAATEIWIADHLALLIAVLLLTGGLLALSRSLEAEAGGAWARLGAGGAVISGALFTVLMASDGIVFKGLAGAWASTYFQMGHVVRELDAALLSLWTVEFFGLTMLVYGLAVAQSQAFPRWLGAAAVVLALAGLVDGFGIAVNGPTFVWFNILFTIVSLLITVWLLVMGLLLWRRADRLPV